MDLPPLNIADFNRYRTSGTVVIKETDMEEEMKNDAKEHVTSGIDRCSGAEGVDYKAASKMIKEAMDKQFGPNWHCIIGQGFSFEITRMQNSTIMLYYQGNLGILLFKC